MLERAISLVGLATLLGLAYLFSTNRKAVKLRTLVWGVSLQCLLAVTILSTGTLSFVGLFILASLVVCFLYDQVGGDTPMAMRVGLAVLAGAGVAGLGWFLVPYRVTDVALVLSLLVAIYAARRGQAALYRPAASSFLMLGVGALWARGIDGQAVFSTLSDKVSGFLALSNDGAAFLFGNLSDSQYFFPGEEAGWPGFGFQFAFSVLPTIIFFSAFMGILYHLGVVQVVIAGMARFMRWSMGTSGSETMSCTANVFVGQTEAPFLIKPFLMGMTVSELHAIMVGGFSTIAGGVLAGYIQMGVDPGHLIAASVMSAPAALVIAKLLLPETERSQTAGDVEIPTIRSSDNVVGAATNGVTDGLKLALNVAAMLLAFIALISFLDVIFAFGDRWIDGRLLGGEVGGKGEYLGVFPGSLATLFGTVLAPLAFLMGVPWHDAPAVGNLLGIKLTVNEFVAYGTLGEHLQAGDLSPRASIIATYALCGFANFSSIGIQIGGIGALAPERRNELSRIGVRAMFGGALASWTTATIAGILL